MSAEQILINNGIQYIQEEIFIYMSKPIVEKQMIRNSWNAWTETDKRSEE